MNTLQVMYFLSYVSVRTPSYVTSFNSYLSYSNLDNQYSEYLTISLISENNFKRGDVNDQIGPKAFYISAADDLPLLVVLILVFIITIMSDVLK